MKPCGYSEAQHTRCQPHQGNKDCKKKSQDVFVKQLVTKLRHHRPWDCAIDQKAMEEYIKEALRQDYIRPSTSPAASSFFFVGKKDGGLRPCIDYQTLNESAIKYRYPLLLVPSALEQLRGAQVFSKLDLRSAHNLIRIRKGDERKTAFITPAGHYELSNVPAVFQGFMNEIFRDLLHRFVIVYIDDILIYSSSLPEHHQHVKVVLQRLREHQLFLKLEKCEFHQESIQFLELQRFLGFTNFYHRFIKGFSLILRKGAKSLCWTSEATNTFKKLTTSFCTTPTLAHPNPELPFIVEVDASTTGVGAVLSQRQGKPPRLHPCAFFSKKLSPAEQNYNIGNWELLAIKLALEEWRHWLEGAKHRFDVITDHRNLKYLRDAKRLNTRQARWSLFFTCFNFKVTYRPGDKNINADSLSSLYQPDSNSSKPESIPPPAMIVSPIQRSIDDHIMEATQTEPAPPGGPEGRIYVPSCLRPSLMDSVHTSPGFGHPGSHQTLSFIQQRYWWPNMTQDVSRYVKGCLTCAMAKVPRRLPEGKLVPLPVPTRPWSHLGVVFITDLPSSDSHSCALIVVDHFSKACKLILLPGLPTAFETAEALFTHIFRHFGIPEDIISDRGPQFISRGGLSQHQCSHWGVYPSIGVPRGGVYPSISVPSWWFIPASVFPLGGLSQHRCSHWGVYPSISVPTGGLSQHQCSHWGVYPSISVPTASVFPLGGLSQHQCSHWGVYPSISVPTGGFIPALVFPLGGLSQHQCSHWGFIPASVFPLGGLSQHQCSHWGVYPSISVPTGGLSQHQCSHWGVYPSISVPTGGFIPASVFPLGGLSQHRCSHWWFIPALVFPLGGLSQHQCSHWGVYPSISVPTGGLSQHQCSLLAEVPKFVFDKQEDRVVV
ncbi:retrotransposable element [Pimephales promelas]|nr:retrotransposable element [Pimephales promelas]